MYPANTDLTHRPILSNTHQLHQAPLQPSTPLQQILTPLRSSGTLLPTLVYACSPCGCGQVFEAVRMGCTLERLEEKVCVLP